MPILDNVLNNCIPSLFIESFCLSSCLIILFVGYLLLRNCLQAMINLLINEMDRVGYNEFKKLFSEFKEYLLPYVYSLGFLYSSTDNDKLENY